MKNDEKNKAVRRLRRRFQRARRSDGNSLSQLRSQLSYELREYKEMIVRIKDEEWKKFVEGK